MTRDRRKRPWLGYVALILLLITISTIAFILSSIEGFLAGVIVVFIGFVVSFFRDDLKKMLGISGDDSAQQHQTIEPQRDPLVKLEKNIIKGREKIEKAISKYEAADKEKKKFKIARNIVENCTLLIATLDQAKSQAIQRGNLDLEEHYNNIITEVEETRATYREQAVETI